MLKRNTMRFSDMEIGERVVPLVYELTEADVNCFQEIVGDSLPLYRDIPTFGERIAPPLILAYNWHRVENQLGGRPGGLHSKQTFEFLNPIRISRRVSVEAWLSEKYQKRGRNYIVVTASCKDDEGRLLARGTSTIAMMEEVRVWLPAKSQENQGGPSVPNPRQDTGELPVLSRDITLERYGRYWREVCKEIATSVHVDPSAAVSLGLGRPIAQANLLLSVVGEWLAMVLGKGWIQGGRLSVAIIGMLFAGETFVVRGEQVGFEKDPDGRRLLFRVVGESETGKTIIIGEASGLVE